jgi:uncharacterized protein (DUF486 family)
VLLLTCSNVFMTFAWYSHLRNWGDKKWYVAAVLSWSIALFEYLFQVPANRAGYAALSLPQLKVLQEVITLCVFAPYAVFICIRQSGSIMSGPGFVCSGRFTSCSVHEYRAGFVDAIGRCIDWAGLHLQRLCDPVKRAGHLAKI